MGLQVTDCSWMRARRENENLFLFEVLTGQDGERHCPATGMLSDRCQPRSPSFHTIPLHSNHVSNANFG